MQQRCTGLDRKIGARQERSGIDALVSSIPPRLAYQCRTAKLEVNCPHFDRTTNPGTFVGHLVVVEVWFEFRFGQA